MRVLSADWVLPVESDPIADGAVAISDDGRIAAVGPVSELGAGERFPQAIILPGFVNAHSHVEYAVYTGFGDGLSFGPWISVHVERKERIGLPEMEAIARLGALECLRSGITTVGDASFAGAAATACAELGLRAIVYVEVFGRDASALERFHEIRERIASALSERVRLGVSPHAPYTCTLEVYRACAELGLPTITHLAESEDETRYLLAGEGPWQDFAELLVPPLGTTGIRGLAEAGVLGPSVVAAHCVQADAEEIALLAAHDVAVAHCPRSNAQLGCGIAPLGDLLDAGLRVGIGTDSPASTPSFDMFDEIRAALHAARARERRPGALTAREALELATLGGARVLGLESEVGSLVPGKQADLTVLSFADSPLLPWEDPVTAVVLGGSPDRVLATVVSGTTRYERGANPWPELSDAARSARARLLSLDSR
ncbi:MAG: amidohydrolase family protein [Thermoleophilia bacterium]|nr:amidohydrolase family protein [Gaiellaceae bacterium]MDW8337635.1 amidohydrolase family protein [Thermoleophilia bacterium]